MILSMNSQDLLEGLNTVTRALSPRPAKQILEGVLISAEDNRVMMTCSDGSLTIEYTNTASVQEEGQVVLPGRIFTEMIRKMPAGMVTITEQDRRSATIRCMKNRSSLAVMNPAEYPEITPMKTGATVKIQQNKLKDMISHVAFAVATDESRQILTAVFWK
jgi:DNA polymerase-3 subunit beta